MQCPSCYTKNNSSHYYCYFCGHKLEPQENEPLSTAGPEYYALSDEEPYQDQQIPLKRYTKSPSSRFSVFLLKLCFFLIAIAAIGFGAIQIYEYLSEVLLAGRHTPERIVATVLTESTLQDGNPAQRIIVHSSNGEKVEALGRTFLFRDDKAEMVFNNIDLHSHFPLSEQDNGIYIDFEMIIYAEGLPSHKETVSIRLGIPVAQLTLLQPAEGEAVVEESSYRLILVVQPNASVFIDGNDYTDLVGYDGKLEKDLIVPELPENIYEVRVTAEGYKDNIVRVVLKRQILGVPLTVNQNIPIQTSNEWAKISGNTLPEATISTTLETREQPAVNAETGEFSMYVRVNNFGYTPCTLTATLEDGQLSQLDIIIYRKTTEAEYTRSAWAADYDELLAYPRLHNGRVFLFVGTVGEVISLGENNVFTVNVSTDPAIRKYILVEYRGEFNFEPGSGIRVFGNRWGNQGEMVKVLAPFIYPQR